MSFGILSGTTSSGLGLSCASAAKVPATRTAATAMRFMKLLPWWVKELVERCDAGLRDLLILVRLHAGDADRADAGAVEHDRQAALHRGDAGHAQELDALADTLLPVGGRAA